MNDRFKYSNNGVYRCENFRQHLAQNTFPRVPIGDVGGIDEWFIKLQMMENDTAVYPYIDCLNKPQFYIRGFLNFMKKDHQQIPKHVNSIRLRESFLARGELWYVSTLLDEKNEYLDDDGALSIEYGIHVMSVLEDGGIWRFNFDDELFDWEAKDSMITCKYKHCITGRERTFYCHKQFFPSEYRKRSVIRIWVKNGSSEQLEKCLQIAHGVRVQLKDNERLQIMEMARDLSLPNVIHYCEHQSIRLRDCTSLGKIDLEDAFKFNLRHVLAFLLKKEDSLEEFIKKRKNLSVDGMSGETMKMLVAKVFEGFT